MSSEQQRSTPPKPLLWRSVALAEHFAAPMLEGLTRHEVFGLAVTVLDRGRRGAARRTERISRRLLHALNVPAASDVNRLLTSIAAVEHQVRTLKNELEDHRTTADRDARGVDRS
jgi:hypothetical protein